ncbi:ABC transporter permease [Leucobacter insecticola]|uniref:ABC transporter permease n=1 Tax=Leucobacter insecticola TaxID=2714934 RepID=A0A6G8FJ30_9MICO|nr:ABC transporter permease [Leucobacter insecticola]QIM16460.1 ABC transporter permease [Leucobacter insecticola]
MNTASRAQLRAFAHLSVMSGKDMMRNRLSGFSMAFMFVFLLLMYFVMWLSFATVGPEPVASVTPANQEVTRALQQAGVTVVDAGSPEENTRVEVSGDSVLATFNTESKPAWNPVWLALRDAGFTTNSITLVNEEGEVRVDLLHLNLGGITMVGIMSVALIGTAVPLVGMRGRGLLRLLATTPLRRSTLLLAQIPARLLVAAIISVVVIGIALWRRYFDGFDLLSFSITLAIGSAMAFALSLILAARSRKEEATQGLAAMLPILLLFAAGGIIPPSMLPGAPEIIMNSLPTTWFAAALSADLGGLPPFLPVPVLWAMMAAIAAIAFVIAARLFEWDQSDPRPRTKISRLENSTGKASS